MSGCPRQRLRHLIERQPSGISLAVGSRDEGQGA